MNEGGEIMTPTIAPEVGLTPEAQPALTTIEPAKAADAPVTPETATEEASSEAQADPVLEEPAESTKEKPVVEDSEEVAEVREELDKLTKKKDEEPTEVEVAPEAKDKKPRVVVNTLAQLRRSIALTMRILILAIFHPKETYSGKDIGVVEDPANDTKDEKLNEIMQPDTSWDDVRNGINNIGERSLDQLISDVLKENDKFVPYMLETATKKAPKKPNKKMGKFGLGFGKRARARA